MAERWVPVVGYEGLYEVSDEGRVRSLARNGTRGCILKHDIHVAGYPGVRLSRDNRKKHFTVHSLVARAFLGPRLPGMECRHLNGIPGDCRLENLMWGTSAQNSQDMILHGRTNSRITHCPQGHEYSESNTYKFDGRRYCKACNRVYTRNRQRHVRAARRVLQ